MGHGDYSITNSVHRSATLYSNATREQIFLSQSINNAMNPNGIVVRECRDSKEHPNSLAIVLGLDETGSMGSIPHHMIKEGLTTLMSDILQAGVQDPEVLFLGIGDHECDNSPLQVGQFEASDELLDKWLKDVYLEGNGGGNAGESYLLAWYFAAYHTSIDCYEKRKQKGFLFTIGDEPTLKRLPKNKVKELMGDGQYEDYTHVGLLEKAKEKYNVYHIHVKETGAGSRREYQDSWKQIMQDDVIFVDRHEDIPKVIAQKIISVLNVTVPYMETTKETQTKTEEIL